MKKQYISFLFILTFLLSITIFIPQKDNFKVEDRIFAASGNWSDYRSSGFSGGDGSESSPYQISSAEEMGYLNYALNSSNNGNYYTKHFELTNDIDLNAHYWTPIGNTDYWCSIVLNGNNHFIKNLTVTERVSVGKPQSQIGFIGLGNGCKISNLMFVSPSVQSSIFVDLAAIVIGDASNGCVLKNVFVIDGFLNVNAYWAGSLVGWKGSSLTSISECYVTCNIYNSSASGWTGGLVGECITPVEKSLFLGNIASYNSSGGLIGVLGSVGGTGGVNNGVVVSNCNVFIESASGSGNKAGFINSVSSNTTVKQLIGVFNLDNFISNNSASSDIYKNIYYIPNNFDVNLWNQKNIMFNGSPYLSIFYW